MPDKMWAVDISAGKYAVFTTEKRAQICSDLYGYHPPREVVVLPVEDYDGMVATNNMNVRELKAMRQARQTFQTHSFD